ncbi:MAG TPA: class III lanthionine synthetase LanKC [Frankiaceae bacterium]|nr:class III lanthionine synthetase LanKC [Frankiaceae bacterium]
MPADNGINLLLLASPEHYESLGRYVPTQEFLSVARELVPRDWRLVRSDTWFNVVAPRHVMPPQGWKIHVSASVDEAAEVLRKTIAVLVDEHVTFKFALDPGLLRNLNGKNWPRAGSGKFVTIYPPDDAAFARIAERLRVALAGHTGPYVLSDRRYKDSGVVHYRYGGFVRTVSLSATGEQQATISAPDGTAVPDDRRPYFSLPPWVSDPFPPEHPAEPEEPVLRDGRYAILRVLHFSNTGGVYLADDTATGRRVVVKEARPHSGGDSGEGNSQDLLTKEHAILEALEPYGIAPRPVELFREWEHLFLVEEYVEGISLLSLSAAENKLLVPNLDPDGAREFRDRLRVLWTNLATTLEAAHAAGVLLGDFAPRNVLVDPRTLDLKLIDFEATVRVGVDAPTRLATPGFASPQHLAVGIAGPADDYYALGALMLASLFPLNTMFLIDPTAPARILRAVARDTAIPEAWRDVIAALLDHDPARRPAPAAVVAALRDDTPPATADVVLPTDEELRATVDGVVRHVIGSADFARRDRLYPADAAVFTTNPLNVATGAAGVAYALFRINGEVPGRTVAWMLSHEVSPAAYPPGLYTGTSGLAWVLGELGEPAAATALMTDVRAHPGRFASHTVHSGAAGYGLAALRLWQLTGDEAFLADAVDAGEHLLASGTDDGETLSWPDAAGVARIGYPQGASGPALFLLYLSLAAGAPRYLAAGRRALAFDLAFATERDGVVSFPGRTDQLGTLFPYWDNGSAGVGTALVRYYAVTGDEEYRKALDPLALDCSRRYASMPSLFRGLAGLGELLLDCHQLLGEPQFREEARVVADGIRLFAVDRPGGTAFPGELLLRLSTDLGTGSAGVALFLHRLATGGPSSHLLLDSLLPDPVG